MSILEAIDSTIGYLHHPSKSSIVLITQDQDILRTEKHVYIPFSAWHIFTQRFFKFISLMHFGTENFCHNITSFIIFVNNSTVVFSRSFTSIVGSTVTAAPILITLGKIFGAAPILGRSPPSLATFTSA